MRFRTRRQRERPPAEMLGLCSLHEHTEKRRSDLARCEDNPTEFQIQRNIPWIEYRLYMGTYDLRYIVPRSRPMLYLYSTCCCIDGQCLRTHELLCARLCLLSTPFRLHSKRGREDSQVTLVTQCSVSQLSDLERLCSSWTGPLSVAVINDDAAPVNRRVNCIVTDIYERVESRGSCALDLSLCEVAPGQPTRDILFPVNALRNIAVATARTDLVLMLVRSRPSSVFDASLGCGAAPRRKLRVRLGSVLPPCVGTSSLDPPHIA